MRYIVCTTMNHMAAGKIKNPVEVFSYINIFPSPECNVKLSERQFGQQSQLSSFIYWSRIMSKQHCNINQSPSQVSFVIEQLNRSLKGDTIR